MLDRILPDSELINSLTLRLGGYYIPIIGVNDFPEETYPAILEYLNRTRMEGLQGIYAFQKRKRKTRHGKKRRLTGEAAKPSFRLSPRLLQGEGVPS